MTVTELANDFKDYIKEDREWKDELMKQLKPILKERADQAAIKNWWKMAYHVVAVVIGLIVSIGLAVHYVIQPLIDSFKK